MLINFNIENKYIYILLLNPNSSYWFILGGNLYLKHKYRLFYLLICIILLVLFLSGCKNKQTEQINTKEIIEQIKPEHIQEVKEVLKDIPENNLSNEEIIDALVNQQLILEQVKKSGIDIESLDDSEKQKVISDILDEEINFKPSEEIETDDLDALIVEQDNSRADALAQVELLNEYLEGLKKDANK